MENKNNNKSDYERALIIKDKIYKWANVIISIACIIVAVVTAFLCALKAIDLKTAGVIIPAAMLIYLVMGLLSLIHTEEKRKTVMIIYIVGISLCAVLLFISVIYKSL